MIKTPSLFLYFSSSILFLLAIFLNSESLTLLVKPVIIPSLLYYYYSESKENINSLFVLSLVLFFVGDMLFLISIKEFYEIGLVIFLLPYIIILSFMTTDLKHVIKSTKAKKMDYTFLIVVVILINLLITVFTVLETKSFLECFFYMLFAIELLVMGTIAAIIYFHSNKKCFFYLSLTVAAFIFSDLFFILNKNVQELVAFKFINGLSQVTSYIFYIIYFFERQKMKISFSS